MKIARHFKENIKELLFFSIQEKRGIVVLLFIIVLIFGLKVFAPSFNQKSNPLPINELNEAVKQIYTVIDTNSRKPFANKSYTNYEKTIDTNTSTNSKVFASNNLEFNKPFPEINNELKKTFQKNAIIEINTADSVALTSVKGIGQWTAGKIVKLRNRYRGLYSKWQLLEIWKMDSARINQISPFISVNPNLVHKFDLNTLEKDSVKGHFYFSFKMVGIIKNYRLQHGLYKSVEEIKKTGVVPDSTYNKIAPYLEIR